MPHMPAPSGKSKQTWASRPAWFPQKLRTILAEETKAWGEQGGIWKAELSCVHPCLLELTFLSTKPPFDVPCKGLGQGPIWAWLGGRGVSRRIQSRDLTQATPMASCIVLREAPGQPQVGGGELALSFTSGA